MVTMLDVSKKAGVSTATVSRVLNSPELVDQSTRELVMQVIEELKYTPNTVARGLASKNTKTVGVVINEFGATYYGRMLDGVQKALAEEGYTMIAEASQATNAGERRAIASLTSRQCEAIIVHSDKLSNEELALLFAANPRLILMNRFLHGFEGRCIYLDNRIGGEIAARHLISMGHNAIGIIAGPANLYEVEHRISGFKKELRSNGRDIDNGDIIYSDFTAAGGKLAFQQLINKNDRLTAVFFLNDEMAAGALIACRELSIDVPKDISFLSFDDEPIASYLIPTLSTIRQPVSEIGYASGKLAVHTVRGTPDEKVQKIFKAELVERDSVRPII